jgi:hypothetical protein
MLAFAVLCVSAPEALFATLCGSTRAEVLHERQSERFDVGI